ncbi:MAG: squalene synthase HpnC [Ignavibacteriaceae bacterium]
MYNESKKIELNIDSLARNHYENFPVSSFLIPVNYRKDIAIVYWFARTADDFADEGNIENVRRLENLNKFEQEFIDSLKSDSENQYFRALSEVINKRKLTIQYFLDLLSAFKQDVIKKRYDNYLDVLEYCVRSANPIGRILLELFNVFDKNAIMYSDKICTALQLTNFYQDTKIDFEKGRIYFPKDEMELFLVTEKMFELNENNPNIKALVRHNINRTQDLFDEGKMIVSYLPSRFKYEIKWTIAGVEKILDKIRKQDYDVFSKRQKLTKMDFFTLFIKNIF